MQNVLKLIKFAINVETFCRGVEDKIKKAVCKTYQKVIYFVYHDETGDVVAAFKIGLG